MKNKSVIFFCVLVAIFTASYWAFFPGGYTYDSYVSYLSSLGAIKYYEITSPVLSIYWKILNNYNFAPLLINYIIFITALLLSIRFTKNYYIAILSLIGICLPYTLITYIFAWKDNALLTVLFLATVLCLNKNKSVLNNIVIVILFFIAFSLRLNAVFAIIPLLYYFLIDRYSRLKAVVLTIVLIMGFQIVNKGINELVFQAEGTDMGQTIMFTDIAKINYLQQKNVTDDIPGQFVNNSNLNSENIDKIFKLYYETGSNDIIYMVPEWRGAKSFLHTSTDDNAINELKTNWRSKVINNPFIYLRIRFSQLFTALWSTSLLYNQSVINFNEETYNRIMLLNQSTKEFNRENKIFSPMANSFAVGIRNLFEKRSEILDLISFPGLYLMLSIIMFLTFLYNSRKNNFYKFGIYVSSSGILYTLGYLPIIPVTDYRYFIWSIFSFWLSLGLMTLAITNGRGVVQSDKMNKSDEMPSIRHDSVNLPTV